MPRASTTARGYGAKHQAERARWERRLKNGHTATCARCGKPIRHGDTWDLGHTDDRTAWTGPECRACNRSAGARNSHGQRQLTRRDW